FVASGMCGVKGLLTVTFDKGGGVNSVIWEKGSLQQRENPFKKDFTGKEMLMDNASAGDIENVNKKLAKKYGEPKRTMNKYITMYEWSDQTRDLYVYLREGRVYYINRPIRTAQKQ